MIINKCTKKLIVNENKQKYKKLIKKKGYYA